MKLGHLLLLLLFLTSLAPLAADPPKSGKIVLHRPLSTGDTYYAKYSLLETYDIVALIKDEIVSKEIESFTIKVEGASKVLAVDEHGRPTHEEILVDKAQQIDGMTTHTLVEKGQTLIAKKVEGKWTFKVNEISVEEWEYANLAGLWEGAELSSAPDDAWAGTDKIQKVGGTWDLDTEVAAKSFSTATLVFDPKTVTGSATVVKSGKTKGVPYLLVKAEAHFPSWNMELPAGFIPKTLKATVTLETKLPFVKTSQPPERKMTLTARATAVMKVEGKDVLYERTLVSKTRIRRQKKK